MVVILNWVCATTVLNKSFNVFKLKIIIYINNDNVITLKINNVNIARIFNFEDESNKFKKRLLTGVLTK